MKLPPVFGMCVNRSCGDAVPVALQLRLSPVAAALQSTCAVVRGGFESEQPGVPGWRAQQPGLSRQRGSFLLLFFGYTEAAIGSVALTQCLECCELVL